jgi:hypothetical protein
MRPPNGPIIRGEECEFQAVRSVRSGLRAASGFGMPPFDRGLAAEPACGRAGRPASPAGIGGRLPGVHPLAGRFQMPRPERHPVTTDTDRSSATAESDGAIAIIGHLCRV